VVGASDQEGAWPLQVTLTDLAGNTNVATLAVVTYDFTPPEVESATVAYVPAADNPLAVAAQAKAGTQIVLVVSAKETPGSVQPPVLSLVCGATSLASGLAASSIATRAVTFQVTVPASLSFDGACTPNVSWRDVAGNFTSTATFSDPAIRVKTSTPTLVVDQVSVAFVRSPWGNSAAETIGAVTIPSGPYFALAPPEAVSSQESFAAGTFTMAGGTLARVRVWGDAVKSALLGSFAPNTSGSGPPARLAGMDVPAAYVTGVDDAGNESAAVAIQQTEWVATPNPSTFGTNPHETLATTYAVASRAQDGAASASVSVGSEAWGADRTSAYAPSGGLWRQSLLASSSPPARSSASAAWDTKRGRMVVFGGGSLDDTWEWDGSGWANRTTAGQRPVSSQCACGNCMAWDSVRERSVFFVGSTPTSSVAEWDGASWTVRSAGSNAIGSGTVAFDAGRGKLVLYLGGGRTYEWNATSGALTQVAWSGPTLVYSNPMVYDSRRARIVAIANGGTETWEWDGAAATWTQRTTSGPRNNYTSLAYDPVRGRTVMFGGRNATTLAFVAETWEWDGSSWTNLTASPLPGSWPAPRSCATLAWDANRRRTVLFAGSDSSNAPLGDTWEWDGTRWTRRDPTSSAPVPRSGHVMAHDPARERTVLFGGVVAGWIKNDTWEWDGRAWTNLTPSPLPSTWPPVLERPGFAFDAVRGRALLFGGKSTSNAVQQAAWEWTGSAWGNLTPSPLPAAWPSRRTEPAMAYDAGRARMVLFGGYDGAANLDDIWEWDGSAWTNRTPSPRPSSWPRARRDAGMVWDAVRGRTVLFGGSSTSGNLADAWEWDGSTWADRTPATGNPAARYGPGMVWDDLRGRTVLFGAWQGGTALGDTLQWDGAAWTSIGSSNIPARGSHATAFDRASGRLVTNGGYGSSLLSDQWELDAPATRQPAVQFSADASTGGFASSAVTGLRVRAHCGGVSPTASGAVLHGWQKGGSGRPAGAWSVLASNAASLASAQPWLPSPPGALVDWIAPSAAEAQRFVVDAGRTLAFQCRPAGLSWSGTAKVALDFVEVRVRYGGSLLVNPGFEHRSTQGWVGGALSTSPHAGGYSLRVTGQSEAYQTVPGPFPAGQSVSYSVWTLPPAGGTSRVDLAGDSWLDTYSTPSGTGTGQWVRLSRVVSLPAATKTLRIRLVEDAPGAAAEFDDAYLKTSLSAGAQTWNPPASCKAVLDAGGATGDGVYWIAPDGVAANAFQVWCDMTTDGGGWTLVMKIDGTKTTFAYDSAYWTNATTYGAGALFYDQNEAKLASFSTVSFARVLLQMRYGGATQSLVVPQAAASLYELLRSGAYVPTSLGRAAWKGLVGAASLQPNCNAEGFNVARETPVRGGSASASSRTTRRTAAAPTRASASEGVATTAARTRTPPAATRRRAAATPATVTRPHSDRSSCAEDRLRLVATRSVRATAGGKEARRTRPLPPRPSRTRPGVQASRIPGPRAARSPCRTRRWRCPRPGSPRDRRRRVPSAPSA